MHQNRYMSKILALATVCLIGLTGPVGAQEDETSEADARKTEARRLAQERAREISIKRQKDATASKYYSQVGRKLYETYEYEKAQELLERALELDPNNREAQQYKRLTDAVLGERQDWVRVATQNLVGEKKVKIQEQIIELETNIDRGRRLYEEAISPVEEDERPDVRYATKIRNLELAISRFERAQEIIKWMPYHVDLTQHEQRVERYLSLSKDYKDDFERMLREIKYGVSVNEREEARQETRDFINQRISALIDQARMYLDKEDWDRAEKLASEIMELDPNNFQAREIFSSARAAKEVVPRLEIEDVREEQKKRLAERLRRSAIPHHKYLIYPSDWDEISRRTVGQRQEIAEPQWMADIRRQMDRRVTFEFVDTPLVEAINFLQALTQVNIILDSQAFEAGGDPNMPITLRVNNMRLELALKWILRLASLDYALKNQAIFISTPQHLAGEVNLVIYDVRDLVRAVQQFPGPEILIDAAGGGAAAGGMGGPTINFGQEQTAAFDSASLRDLISNRIRPGSWGPEFGTSIEEREGKLIVLQRPEVHMMIEELLQSFRESQTLQVMVQARFIEVVDSFLEDIGVNWVDLPPTGYAGNPVNVDSYEGFPNNLTALPFVPVPPPGQPVIGGQPYHQNAPPFTTTGTAFRDEADSGPFSGPTDYRLRSVHRNSTISPFRTRLGTDYEMGAGQGAVFQFAFLGNIQAQMILHMVTREEKGDLLLAPRLTMYNNQRAYILVANQRAYISDYDISGGVFDPVINTILEGVVLDVKPTVSHDRRYVTLEMRPGTAQRLRFRTIYIGGGAIQLPIQLPTIELRSVRTTVTLPDGGTVLISGLMTNHKFNAHSGIPVASDLPIVGRLFGSDLVQREEQNLVVLVTANLILFNEEEAKL